MESSWRIGRPRAKWANAHVGKRPDNGHIHAGPSSNFMLDFLPRLSQKAIKFWNRYIHFRISHRSVTFWISSRTMNSKIRQRFAAAIAARGYNLTTASVAAGLSKTYCRDVIKRGRGNFEWMELVIVNIGASWEWVKTGKGPMDLDAAKESLIEDLAAEIIKKPKQRKTTRRHPDQGTASVTVSRAALTQILSSSLRLVKRPLTENEIQALTQLALSMLEEHTAQPQEPAESLPAAPPARIFENG